MSFMRKIQYKAEILLMHPCNQSKDSFKDVLNGTDHLIQGRSILLHHLREI